MLFKISLLTAYLFAVIYPLCFFIHVQNPIKHNFHKFHIGLPNVIGGLVLIVILFSNLPTPIKIYVLVWKLSLLAISCYSWKKETPNPILFLIPTALGFYVFFLLEGYYIQQDNLMHAISILGSLVFCSSLYAMNLGHFYLNVHGLPIEHLKRATLVFWFFVLCRFVWDMIYLVTGKIFYKFEMMPVYKFLLSMDGFLLLVALFFGTLLPLFCNYFVYETLKLKNTQSATGILYVILCAVVLGDLTYKYYLIIYGIIM